MAVRALEQVEESLDPVGAFVAATLAEIGRVVADRLGGVDDGASESVRVDRIRAWERLRSAVAAGQASELVGFARARVDRALAEGKDPGLVGDTVAEEVGLACRISATAAARRLSSARALWVDLPETFAELTNGEVSERVAEVVVSETRHLHPGARRAVDAAVVASGLAELGLQAAMRRTARLAYEADREAYVGRGRHARSDRRVGLRPAPDTMSVLSGYLPVEQGVACLAALRKHTDTLVAGGDGRTRGQIMADTLVERVTGQVAATDVPVEVQLVVPAELLTDPESPRTAMLPGGLPLPGPLAREVVDASRGAKTARRLHASPAGQLVGIGRRRRFTGPLADLVVARDQTCREPYCDAPIRHLDHVHRFIEGGQTTLANGRGLCARHNLAREQPGWSASVVHDGLGDQPHTVRTTTPTGHSYESRAPDPP